MVFGKLVSFAIGIYAGVYIDQNYKLPNADDPKELWNKIKEYAEQYRKEHPGPKKE